MSDIVVVMMKLGCVLVVAVAACGNVDDNASDASVPSDADLDSSPPIDSPVGRCDLTKPLATPVLVSGINTAEGDQDIVMTDDELVAYFSSNRDAPGTANFDIYVTTRATRDTAFGAATAIAAINSGADDRGPSISADGLDLFFHSSRDATTAYDLYVSHRANTAAAFGAPVKLPATVNTTDNETSGYVTADGTTLYFVRATSTGPDVLYSSTLGPTGFAAATTVPSLQTAGDAFAAVISKDQLTVYFTSTRTGGVGSSDIWRATRSSKTDPFASIVNVSEVNSTSQDRPAWISPDGCRLYLWSTRPGGVGGVDTWQATRPQ